MRRDSAYLLDRLEIQDVFTHYATAVDRRDIVLFRSLFVKDVHVSGFTPGTFDDLEAWIEFVEATLRTFGATHHLIGNVVVEIRGDEAEASADLQATHELLARPGALLLLWATYHLTLVRTPEGWKIARHRLEPRLTRIVES